MYKLNAGVARSIADVQLEESGEDVDALGDLGLDAAAVAEPRPAAAAASVLTRLMLLLIHRLLKRAQIVFALTEDTGTVAAAIGRRGPVDVVRDLLLGEREHEIGHWNVGRSVVCLNLSFLTKLR